VTIATLIRMDPTVLELLQRQQRDGFPDLAGSEVAATIPISDRVLNELIAGLLSNGGKVRDVRLRAEEGNRLTAEIQLAGPRFLPTLAVRIAIEDQPELPARPTLGLRLAGPFGLVGRAASLLPSLALLPPGIALDGDRLEIDIRRLLAERGMEGWLEYLSELRVNTRAGAIVLDVRARIRPK
jgi:hypothetical protein